MTPQARDLERDAARYALLRSAYAKDLCEHLYGQEQQTETMPEDWGRELDEWVDAEIARCG